MKSIRSRLGVIISVCLLSFPSQSQTTKSPPESPPGLLVTVGSHRMHIHCLGPESAAATVVFESGAGGDSRGWKRVRDLLPPDVRSCAYDRAGSGWSEPGPAPRTLRQEILELHALLDAAGIRGPLVLVGHSLGGILTRLYAESYSSNVVGLVLVDPTHESSVLGSLRYGGWVRLREKAVHRAVPEPHLEGTPPAVYSPNEDYLPEELQQIHLSRQGNPRPLGNRPLIVLGAGRRPQPPGTPDDLWKELKQEKDEQIRDLGTLSGNSKVIFDPSSGHALHADNPRLVAQAIREVLEALVNKTQLQSGVRQHPGRPD